MGLLCGTGILSCCLITSPDEESCGQADNQQNQNVDSGHGRSPVMSEQKHVGIMPNAIEIVILRWSRRDHRSVLCRVRETPALQEKAAATILIEVEAPHLLRGILSPLKLRGTRGGVLRTADETPCRKEAAASRRWKRGQSPSRAPQAAAKPELILAGVGAVPAAVRGLIQPKAFLDCKRHA